MSLVNVNVSPKELAVIGVVAVGAMWWIKKKAVAAVKENVNAINPTNPGNIFYGGVNELGASITGDSDFSLGSWMYDKINPAANNTKMESPL